MKKGINYWAFPASDAGVPLALEEAFSYAASLGFEVFEPTVDGPGSPLSLETTRREAESLRVSAEKAGIEIATVASGLAWGCSPTDPDPAVRKQAVENSAKVMEIASWLGAETILYLPGMVSAPFIPDFTPQQYDDVDARAREAVSRLLDTAEKLGIRMGVENVWNRYLLSPLEMREFIDSFQSEYVGSYFDVGNTMLYGHPEHWIRILGDRIFAVHMKDFRREVGSLNGFVDLLAGDVCFPEVMKTFREIGYSGVYVAEYVPPTLGAAEKAAAALKLIEQM